MKRRHTIRDSIASPGHKRDYNEGLFTRVAEEYDLVTRAMSFGRDPVWKRRLAALLPDQSEPRCVDLACGTGDVTFELARRFPDGEIVGLDLTPAMVEVARRRNDTPQVSFRIGDMCRTDFPDGWADVVTGSYALRNAPVLEDALREIHRILRPGGHAAFLDFSKSPSPWLARMQMPLLKCWGGLCGLIFHGKPEHAYIAESLRQFPDRHRLRAILAAAGFEILESRDCFGGMLSILLLRKPAA